MENIICATCKHCGNHETTICEVDGSELDDIYEPNEEGFCDSYEEW